MQSLATVSIFSNQLTGSIPPSLGDMISAESIDLSNNHLSGQIPKSLEKLRFLRNFNVSFNKLSGEIPNGGPFANITYECFISNEALCGDPQFHVPLCPESPSHRSRIRRWLLITIIVAAISSFLSVVLCLLWIIRRKRKHVPPQEESQHGTTTGRFSYRKLQQATEFFSETNLLGAGSFGHVYRASFEDGTLLAVKVFNLQLESGAKSFETECEVLRSLRHRNLTKVVGACSSIDFKALVLEYMQNGSLEDWLYSDRGFLDARQRLDIMIDVASALEYLHLGYDTPVIHCDLKPSNILLDKDMVGHVTDFGMAKLLRLDESNVHTTTLATLGYIAPEYGKEGVVSSACDVYSYGIVLMEAFTGRRPTDDLFGDDWQLRSWVRTSLPDRLSQVLDDNLLGAEQRSTEKLHFVSRILQLASDCTAESPKERPKMKDVLTTLKKIR